MVNVRDLYMFLLVAGVVFAVVRGVGYLMTRDNPGRLRYPPTHIPMRLYVEAFGMLLEHWQLWPETVKVELFVTPAVARDILLAIYHRERSLFATRTSEGSWAEGDRYLDLDLANAHSATKRHLVISENLHCHIVQDAIYNIGKQLQKDGKIARARSDIRNLLSTHDCNSHLQEDQALSSYSGRRLIVVRDDEDGGEETVDEETEDADGWLKW